VVVTFTTHLNPEEGGSTALRNVGIQALHFTAKQRRKPRILEVLVVNALSRIEPEYPSNVPPCPVLLCDVKE